MSLVDTFDYSNLPEAELSLPPNTPQDPHAVALIVKSTPNTHSAHSVPSNPPAPVPKEDFIDTTKNQPSQFNNGIELPDEYLQTRFDRFGEAKISKNGWFYDQSKQERVLLTTFTLPGKGKKLYCLTSDVSKELGYRDSYLLTQRNKSLLKYQVDADDKEFLIEQGIIPVLFKSRAVGVMSFRSVYLIFGARLLKYGKRLDDDYWEDLGKETGFSDSDPVFSDTKKLTWSDEKPIRKEKKGKSERSKKLSPKFSNKNLDSSFDQPTDSIDGINAQFKKPHSNSVASKFSIVQSTPININFKQKAQLDTLLLADPTEEAKQNYLLSSGVTNVPIYSKPTITSENYNFDINQRPKITSPGGSTPPSITSSLLNSEDLISTNGDNIYPVTCLSGQSISGDISLNKNILSSNYAKLSKNLKGDMSKLDELVKTVPMTNNKKILGKNSNIGLKFNEFGHVVDVLTKPQVEGEPESIKFNPKTKGYDLEGVGTNFKRLKGLDYSQNTLSLSHSISKISEERKGQWNYYWFKKSGGFEIYQKNLKRYYKNSKKPITDKIVKDGKYFKYTVIPKSENSFIKQDPEVVENDGEYVMDLNEDSDVEVLDETTRPLTNSDMLTHYSRMKLTEQRDKLVEQYKREKYEQFHRQQQQSQLQGQPSGFTPLKEPVINMNEIKIQSMMKMKIFRKADYNSNCIDPSVELQGEI